MTPTLSVIIRCFNEESHIGRLLTGISRQTVQPYEVIVVDSGSTDATLAIAERFGVKIVHIAPGDFSFGGALNRGIEEATSEIAVLASAHVYPVYDTWLEHLVEPLANDDAVALSYGRQVVPPDGSFSERRLLAQWFPSTSSDRQKHPFCNNANSAIRRSVWESLPFDDRLTGLEDLDWAKKVLERGHFLAYRANAPIVHVHDETLGQVINRYRREAIAHKQIYDEQALPLWKAMKLGLVNVAGDFGEALREGVLVAEARGIVRFRFAQFYGAYRGFRQTGPISELLRWRFYYPPQERSGGVADDASVGNQINYDEQLEPEA